MERVCKQSGELFPEFVLRDFLVQCYLIGPIPQAPTSDDLTYQLRALVTRIHVSIVSVPAQYSTR
jgi:hypothetical protein